MPGRAGMALRATRRSLNAWDAMRSRSRALRLRAYRSKNSQTAEVVVLMVSVFLDTKPHDVVGARLFKSQCERPVRCAERPGRGMALNRDPRGPIDGLGLAQTSHGIVRPTPRRPGGFERSMRCAITPTVAAHARPRP